MSVWDWYFDNSGANDNPIEVEYQFDAGEREVTYYNDGSGHPGDASSVSIHKFKFRGVDITKIIWALVESDAIDELEMEINEYEDNGGRWDITDYVE